MPGIECRRDLNMRIILYLLAMLPTIVLGQQQVVKGIRFEQHRSWENIKAEARTTGKLIFVDCYATWCMPCRKMDLNIFTIDSVGEYLNDKYVCVRVQMDTSKNDDDFVKSWYAIAHEIQSKHKVLAFPSYLFFSPDGEILHRDMGYKKAHDFLCLARDAVDPQKEYFVLLRRYRQGYTDYQTMPYLAQLSRKIDENSLADSIASVYIDHYLLKLGEGALYTKENIEFLVSFDGLIETNKKSFYCFFDHGDRVDSIMKINGLSEYIVDAVVTREMITPWMTDPGKHVAPNWNMIYNSVGRKWGEKCADRTVLNAKVNWYNQAKIWSEYTKYLVEKVDKYGVGKIMADAMLNDNAYYVFMRSNNKKELNRGLSWIDESLKMGKSDDANKMDTKSNLLYKLGETQQAIDLEEKAFQLAPTNKDIRDNLAKMKKGEPTWPLD